MRNRHPIRERHLRSEPAPDRPCRRHVNHLRFPGLPANRTARSPSRDADMSPSLGTGGPSARRRARSVTSHIVSEPGPRRRVLTRPDREQPGRRERSGQPPVGALRRRNRAVGSSGSEPTPTGTGSSRSCTVTDVAPPSGRATASRSAPGLNATAGSRAAPPTWAGATRRTSAGPRGSARSSRSTAPSWRATASTRESPTNRTSAAAAAPSTSGTARRVGIQRSVRSQSVAVAGEGGCDHRGARRRSAPGRGSRPSRPDEGRLRRSRGQSACRRYRRSPPAAGPPGPCTPERAGTSSTPSGSRSPPSLPVSSARGGRGRVTDHRPNHPGHQRLPRPRPRASPRPARRPALRWWLSTGAIRRGRPWGSGVAEVPERDFGPPPRSRRRRGPGRARTATAL